MRKRWAVIAAGCLIAGCGGGVDGVEVTGVPQERWDPCSIPADALAGTGLDPALGGAGWGEGIEVDDWSRCVWEHVDGDLRYSFTALTSTMFDSTDLRNNTQFRDFTETTFGARTGSLHYYTSYTEAERCGIVFDTDQGVVSLSLTNEGTTLLDSCAILLDHAADLIDYFPPTQ
ncbi:DUF3558 family protein [Rhodococcus sp. B10]|uniref:DUF3558 family protein n=1 Tax=Rhodococcus sp. B10 TaxID=2695876 RepID=UPI001431478B|nr:hypothetical protein [Rhodococcus sp. B10]